MNICVVIPVYNEACHLGEVVEAVKKKQLDVVVIDDGSTDNSGTAARERGAVVIRNECKSGKGSSLRKGFAYALQKQYSGVITLDGDGQHDIRDLDGFLEKLVQDPNGIVTGNRMGHSKAMPCVRRLTNDFMSFLISKICKQAIPDTQCGYRYVSSAVLRAIDLTSDGFEIESEVLIKASKKGFNISSIPVQTIYRDEESKINPLRDTYRFFMYLMREMRC